MNAGSKGDNVIKEEEAKMALKFFKKKALFGIFLKITDDK